MIPTPLLERVEQCFTPLYAPEWNRFLTERLAIPFAPNVPNAVFHAYPAFACEVLRVANSPLYGMAGSIASIDVARSVLGYKHINEAVLSALTRSHIQSSILKESSFDYANFFRYSLFCSAAAVVIAEKVGYRFPAEAATAAALHDIGVLLIAALLPDEYSEIQALLLTESVALPTAEQRILGATHADLGGWFATKLHFPSRVVHAIEFHHHPGAQFAIAPHSVFATRLGRSSLLLGEGLLLSHPLTAIVALTEWFAEKLGFKQWAGEQKSPLLNIPATIFHRLGAHSLLDSDSAVEALQPLLINAYKRAAEDLRLAFK